MMLLSSKAVRKLDRAVQWERRAMRRRWWVGLGVGLVVVAAVLFLGLRGRAPQPRYLQITKGMKWDRAEKIMGTDAYAVYLVDGMLEKYYPDVDGRVKVAIDGEEVADVEYMPD